MIAVGQLKSLNSRSCVRWVIILLISAGVALLITELQADSPRPCFHQGATGSVLISHTTNSADPASRVYLKTSDHEWESAAKRNLSDYRATLLAKLHPLYNSTQFWPHFPPIISCPPDRPLTRYGGHRDGSKLLCKISNALQRDTPCVIYSLGSNGDFSFEQAMLQESRCEIHTFDCTYKAGASQAKGRHFYHAWCIGDPESGQDFKTWGQITETLGHSKVDLLKMDIEGFENSVLSTFKFDDRLPEEISMEFHVPPQRLVGSLRVPVSPAELGLSFMHLANLGYASYSQEVNAVEPICCCEFTFMRVEV